MHSASSSSTRSTRAMSGSPAATRSRSTGSTTTKSGNDERRRRQRRDAAGPDGAARHARGRVPRVVRQRARARARHAPRLQQRGPFRLHTGLAALHGVLRPDQSRRARGRRVPPHRWPEPLDLEQACARARDRLRAPRALARPGRPGNGKAMVRIASDDLDAVARAAGRLGDSAPQASVRVWENAVPAGETTIMLDASAAALIPDWPAAALAEAVGDLAGSLVGVWRYTRYRRWT